MISQEPSHFIQTFILKNMQVKESLQVKLKAVYIWKKKKQIKRIFTQSKVTGKRKKKHINA